MLMGFRGSRASSMGFLGTKGCCGWGSDVVAYVLTLLTISRFERRFFESF